MDQDAPLSANSRNRANWFFVGVLVALTVAALPSFGLIIAPFALAGLVIMAFRSKGRGFAGFLAGAVLLAATLAVISYLTW